MPVLHERRKYVRYKLPYGMLYVFDHYSARVGWVRDVGLGGLSLEYNPGSIAEGIAEVIDIFAYDQEFFYLPAVPCHKTFWLNKGKRYPCSTHLNQTCCGHHFVSLTPKQKIKWHELINKLTKYSDLAATVYEPFT